MITQSYDRVNKVEIGPLTIPDRSTGQTEYSRTITLIRNHEVLNIILYSDDKDGLAF